MDAALQNIFSGKNRHGVYPETTAQTNSHREATQQMSPATAQRLMLSPSLPAPLFASSANAELSVGLQWPTTTAHPQ